jgi:hypothetical protein
MPEPKKNPADVSRELQQRAALTWQGLGEGRLTPESVEVLQDERLRTVYRLRGCGPTGADVIAKRCRHVVALKECTIYEKVLSQLAAVPTVKFFGFAAEEDAKYAWVFLEDAGGEAYSPDRADHRLLAGRWLGLLHTEGAELAKPTWLRDPGPACFKPHLQATFDTIQETSSNPHLAPSDVGVLETIDAQCRVVASRWDELEAFCERMPRTVVHGDFKEDHLRIRQSPTGALLLCFDWHEGGWGVPALDLAKFLGYAVNPDIGAYCAIVQERWSEFDQSAVKRLGFVGEAFRCLASIRWEVERLRYEWVEAPMATLRIYTGWLNDIIKAEPWAEEARLGPQAREFKPRSWV